MRKGDILVAMVVAVDLCIITILLDGVGLSRSSLYNAVSNR